MKKVFLDAITLFTHLLFFSTIKANIQSKILNGDDDGMSTGLSCGTSGEPNDGMFWERPRDVGHTY